MYQAWNIHQGSGLWKLEAHLGGANWDIGDANVLRTTTDTRDSAWHHIAFVRSGNNWYAFTDGVLEDSVIGVSGTISASTAPNLRIGSASNDTSFFGGYLDELRISKGIARWTSDFTPPSSPYGKVATVTSQKKFGTASGEFKGSGEYLSLADSDDWNFGTGDFTIDAWVRFADVTTQQTIFAQYTSGSHYFEIKIDANAALRFAFFNSGGSILFNSANSQFSTNTWYHLALIRNGNNFNAYKDGVSIASTTSSVAIDNHITVFTIGAANVGFSTPSEFVNGTLDEVRVSKGIARWTANFTPPTAPYETDTTPPTVSSTSPASSATGVGVSSAISATFSEDMNSSTITTSTFTLSSSSGSSVSGTVSYSNKVATFTPSSSLSYSTTYTATITTGVKDAGGNAMSSNYTWSFTTGSAPDTTSPTGSVSGASYTNSSTVTLTLSATDNVGVTGYYVSDSSTTPSTSASGWTSVTSTTSYSATVSYSLSSGEGSKTIYAWYKDAAGNVSSTANATITYDTTVPTVTISSPTSSSTYTATTSTITLSGSASDSSSGINSVSWSNNRGGNGTATGTASWTVSRYILIKR